MPLVPNFKLGDDIQLSPVTLDGATDQLNFANGKYQLVIDNQSAGAITLTLTNPDGGIVNCPGLGDTDTSGGYTLPEIAAGETQSFYLTDIRDWLGATTNITGGSASVTAMTLQF